MRLALLTLLTMIAFAANSVLNRLGVAGGQIGAAEFAAVRLLSGAGMLLALVGLRAALRGTAIWPGGRGRLVGPLSLLVYLFGFSWAYRSLPAGAGALILFGTVQITMFAGALLGREAVPGARWAGAGLAFSGLCLLLVPGGAEVSLPHAAAMALALTSRMSALHESCSLRECIAVCIEITPLSSRSTRRTNFLQKQGRRDASNNIVANTSGASSRHGRDALRACRAGSECGAFLRATDISSINCVHEF